MTEKTNYNLTPHVEELTEIIIDLVLSKYNNIAIIAMYGSRARGDYHPSSDLEFFAIADEEIEGKSDISFLFNGITVSVGIHPRNNYEKIENREVYWVVPAGTIAKAKIVYWRSEEDLKWYERIRKKIIEDHENPEMYSITKAEETYSNMVQTLGQLSIARLHNDLYEAHNNIGGLVIGYAIVLAQANGRFLINNWGKNLDDTYTFPNQPRDTKELFDKLVVETDIDQICDLATQLVDKVRVFLLEFEDKLDNPLELEMLDDLVSLEYLYKMDKAISMNHLPALSYAISDSEQLFAKDLLKIQNKWKQTSHLQLHSDFMRDYLKDFPNLRKLMLEGDMEKLRVAIDITWNKINSLLESRIDVPNFTEIDEVKPYFANINMNKSA